jgi:hypothetical protein
VHSAVHCLEEDKFMDPVVTAVILSSLVTPLAKQLLDKATDPEMVARGVNWVLSAADHFLKMRRGQVDPRESAPVPSDFGAVSENVQASSSLSVKPELEAFSLEILTTQVESSMGQIRTYVRNLQDLLERAALEGGEEYLDPGTRNQIRAQRKYIGERLNELAGLMTQVYGVQVGGIDKLTEVLSTI